MVLTKIRNGIDRLFLILDAEGVGIFQAVVYVHIVGAGLYMMIFAGGGVPQAVEDELGSNWNALWLWSCLGPGVCLFGKWLNRFPSQRWIGLLLQTVGDIVAFAAFATYVTATVAAGWWGKAYFAVFVCISISECIALLVVRDFRRIQQVEKVVRQ